MFEDTKGVIRSRKSRKNRHCNGVMFEDTKGVIRSRINQGRTENAMAK